VGVTTDVLSEAMRLAERHYLRGYDAVQLAAALAVRRLQSPDDEPLILLSADGELNAAARQQGLTVQDPTDAP
jgi:uncharacterized protein